MSSPVTGVLLEVLARECHNVQQDVETRYTPSLLMPRPPTQKIRTWGHVKRNVWRQCLSGMENQGTYQRRTLFLDDQVHMVQPGAFG
jgi:GH35 family endo-1,4-beta-xylanase